MTTTPTAALVEEAEKLSNQATPGPWRVGTVHAAEEVWAAYPEGLAGLASERLLLRLNPNFTSEQDTAFIARARQLVPELVAALRRAEAERDELRATVTRLNRRAQTAEAGVRDNVEASKMAGKSMGRTLANAAAAMYRRRAEKAEAERDAQHAEVLRLTGERDVITIHACPPRGSDRMPCCGRVPFELLGDRITCLPELVNCDRMRLLQGVTELTATRDLLNEENARLQARVATLELLLRGGK